MGSANRPIRSVITGGPGAGKSTLLSALGERGVHIFPEVARTILQKPGGMEMRAGRPMDFAIAMLDAELASWKNSAAGLSVHDRGFPDIVGFLNLESLPVPDILHRLCHEQRYQGPIFHAPPWAEIYSPDEERIQDWQQALASDAAVCAAWRDYGYTLIELPCVPVEGRVEFVLAALGVAGGGE